MVQPSYSGRPHPIGYLEHQRSFLKGGDSTRFAGEIEALVAKTLFEEPHLKHISTRWETSPTSEMVIAYVGFAPKHVSSEPLDPRNLNAAPAPTVGMPTAEDLGIPLGYKEEKFNRGT